MAITLNQLPDTSIGLRGTWFVSSADAPGAGVNYDDVKDAGRAWGGCDTPEGYFYFVGNFDKAYNKAGTEFTRTFLGRMDWATMDLNSWNPTVLPAPSSGNNWNGGVCYEAVYDDRFGGRVYVCGNFSSIAGTTVRGIACLDATTGAVIDIFGAGAQDTGTGVGTVRDMDLVNGSLYLAGSFRKVMGVSRDRIARIDFDGSGNPSVNTGFNPGASAPLGGCKGGITTTGSYRIFVSTDGATQTVGGTSGRLFALNESGVTQWGVVTSGNSLVDLDVDDVNKLVKVGSTGALTSGGNRGITFNYSGVQQWFYASNGDCQSCGHYYDIQLFGFHDKRIASVKDSTTMALDCSGFWCTGPTGVLNAWRPEFTSSASPEATGVLKLWLSRGIETRGYVVLGGDYNHVAGTGGTPSATRRHIAFYKDTSWVDVGPPPPPPGGSGLGDLPSIPNLTGFGGVRGNVNIVPGGAFTVGHSATALLVATVTAGKMDWTRIKPDGAGGMMDMCQDAKDPLVWYMAEDVGSISISRDGGVSWEGGSYGLYLEVHRKCASIQSFVDPSNSAQSLTIACFGQGTSGATAYTRDKGKTWTVTSGGGNLEFNSQNAASGVGTPALSSVGKPRSVAGLVDNDPTGGGGGYTYFGTYTNGLFRSTDIGATATKLGLQGAYIRSVFRNGNDVYVGVLNAGGFRGMYRFGTARTRASGTTGTGDGQCMPSGVRHVEHIFIVSGIMYAVCATDGVWRNKVAPFDNQGNWEQMTGLPGGWWFCGSGKPGNGGVVTIMVGAHNPSLRTGSKYNSIMRCPNAEAAIGNLNWEWKSDPGDSNELGGNLNVIASDGLRFDPAGEEDKFPGHNDCELFSMVQDWNDPNHWEVLGGGGASWGTYNNGDLWNAHSRGSAIASMRGVSPDPQRSGTGLIACQDHDAFRWLSGGNTVLRITLPSTTIGYCVHCAYDGSYLVGHGDDNNNEGLVYRAASPGSSGVPTFTRLSWQPGGASAGAAWGNRCYGLWVIKKSNGQPRLLGIFEGLGMRYTDDWGATAWSTGTGYPSPGTPGADERGTPWEIRSAQYGGAGTDGNVFAACRTGANVGIWHSPNYGASGWTKIASATVTDISQLWLAVHPGDPTVVYFTDSTDNLHRIRAATTSPVVDTIAMPSGCQPLGVWFDVDSTLHDFVDDLYVYCRPKGNSSTNRNARVLKRSNMPKTGTSITWTVDYMDPADGALTDQGRAAGGVGVSECCSHDGDVFLSVRSRSTLRGQLV